MSKELVARVNAVKRRHMGDLFSRRNVVACGIGFKTSAGVQTDQLGLLVSVTHKVHPSALSAEDLIPSEVDGIRTDVVETGVLQAQSSATDRWRPQVPPGASVGHFRISAGTFGCLVRRGDHVYVLSNNHVLAEMNKGRAGDAILQPAPADGGMMEDQVATLADYIPLDFGVEAPECPVAGLLATVLNGLARLVGSGHRLQAVHETPGINQVDAALALPLSADLVGKKILHIGVPTGAGQAELGTRVQKTGRTTGHTTGTITQIDATVRIDYYGPTAVFENQLIASPMSEPGDSGSAVLDEERHVVGLLFAGSDRATIINPIESVLSALNVEIVV